MAELCRVRVDWDRTALPYKLPGFHTLHLGPEPGYPFGRKGAGLLGAWNQLSTPTCDGMLLMDGDVAADLLDLAAMLAAIHVKPDITHVAPVRLWPATTRQDGWVWGHWEDDMTQAPVDNPRRFSFCFTYLPRRLISACARAGMEGWTFPQVDRLVSLECRKQRIPVNVVDGCTPKHLHF
jgi:hypothetical protein